ncbi:MAG: hypothetical protein J5734_04105 [Prevotella sp.]|nr:hypothetical protein [Prevotella sp.]MBR5036474.1 hypothetical protein [Prevotella sp.]
MKRRELKLVVNYVCDELFAECVAASMYCGNPDPNNVEALLVSIAEMRDDYISRISHPEPGMPPKKYFDDLKNSFNERVSEIIDHINNMN